MERQILSPTVHDGKEANFCAQMPGIGCDRLQGFGSRVEENVVHRCLVLKGDRGDFLRHGKNDVEVLGIEQFGLAIFQPLGSGERLTFWTISVAARIIRDPLIAAIVALFDMTPKRCCSTTLDCGHGGTLRGGQRAPAHRSIVVTIAAEHIRHLQPRTAH